MGLTTEELERLKFLNKMIMTLEWDKGNQQLNPGMEVKLEDYLKERTKLHDKLSGTVTEAETSDETEKLIEN